MIPIYDPALYAEMNHQVCFYFRRSGGLPGVLRVAAANCFQVFADAEPVFYGPLRAGHGASYIHEIPVGKARSLAVLVAGYLVNNYYSVNEAPFFAAELVEDGKVVANSRDFAMFRMTDKLIRVQRYSFQRTFVEAYEMSACRTGFFLGGEGFVPLKPEEVAANALLENPLPLPRLELLEALVVETGKLERDPGRTRFRPDFLTKVDGFRIQGYPQDELDVCVSDLACELRGLAGEAPADGWLADGYALYDLGRNVTGFLEVEVDVGRDCLLLLTFDEILYDEAAEDETLAKDFCYPGCGRPLVFYRGETCNCLYYRLAAGRYRLTGFEPYTLRYLKAAVTEGCARVLLAGVILYQSPAEYAPRLADPQLQRIAEAAVDTFRQNGVDVPTDCPSRERAGWLCDSFFTSRVERLITGANALEENLLWAILRQPEFPGLPAGMLPMCYPADHPDGVFIPNWAMWFVLELKDYLLRGGKRELADAAKSKVYGLLDYFAGCLGRDGLLRRLNGWVFVEWSRSNDFVQDVNFPTNILYAAMLRAVDDLYGDEGARLLADRVERAVRKYSWDGEFFQDNAVLNEEGKLQTICNRTETCQYYALYFGLCEGEEYADFRRKMAEAFGPGRDAAKTYPDVFPSNAFIGDYLRLDWLLRRGDYARVRRECKRYFSGMAARTGTLWEHDRPSASCNHGFASYALYLLEKAERA